MSKRNGLSGMIEDNHDGRPHSDGPWANAWAPVWEEPVAAQSAAPQSLNQQIESKETAEREAEPNYA